MFRDVGEYLQMANIYVIVVKFIESVCNMNGMNETVNFFLENSYTFVPYYIEFDGTTHNGLVITKM